MKFVGVIPFSAAERSGDYCFRLKRESEKWNGRVRNCVFVCQFSFSSSVSTRLLSCWHHKSCMSLTMFYFLSFLSLKTHFCPLYFYKVVNLALNFNNYIFETSTLVHFVRVSLVWGQYNTYMNIKFNYSNVTCIFNDSDVTWTSIVFENSHKWTSWGSNPLITFGISISVFMPSS